MPWSARQHRLFSAIAHGWKPSDPKLQHLSQGTAQKLAAEGVKDDPRADSRRAILRAE